MEEGDGFLKLCFVDFEKVGRKGEREREGSEDLTQSFFFLFSFHCS